MQSYAILYTSRNPETNSTDFQNLLNTPGLKTLSELEKFKCEGEVSYDECLKTLNKMNEGKSPGCDGLTAEFYMKFWPTIGKMVVDYFNYSANHGELSQSQKRGAINLLEKRGKNPDLIKNLRPASLTNVDYKILTKTLALRTEEIIPNIIHENQSGFVKGRYIGENIRLIQDIMTKLKDTKQSELLLLLDFEKAFDSIEWPYMHKILEKFNFGPSFRNWIKICYTNISSTIMNNGFTSGWFHITRGVRQGYPLSTILFITCVRLLAQLIRNDSEIKAITIGEKEHKISLFTDDTTCIVEIIESVSRFFETT